MAVGKLDPSKLWIGDIVLVASGNKITEAVQRRLGYGDSSVWTHTAGCIGGYDLIEGQQPKSRVCSLQKDYVDKNFTVKVLRRSWVDDQDRIKVALWWATFNNLSYNYWGLLLFLFRLFDNVILFTQNVFKAKSRLICSELIADGFLRQGYNLFGKPSSEVLPADYDNAEFFQTVEDVWLQ